MTGIIRYSAGYKYQLEDDASFDVSAFGIRSTAGEIGNDFVTIDEDGLLHIAKGYAWDGSSGPAIDTRSSQRASLAHDALYQLVGHGSLPVSLRRNADRVYRSICLEDGSFHPLAWWRYAAIRWFGPRHGSRDHKIFTAP